MVANQYIWVQELHLYMVDIFAFLEEVYVQLVAVLQKASANLLLTLLDDSARSVNENYLNINDIPFNFAMKTSYSNS